MLRLRGAGIPVRTRVAAVFAFVFTFLTVVAHCSNINNSEVSGNFLPPLSLFGSRENVGKIKTFLDLHNPNPENLKFSIFFFFINDRLHAAEPAWQRIATVSSIHSFHYIFILTAFSNIGILSN